MQLNPRLDLRAWSKQQKQDEKRSWLFLSYSVFQVQSVRMCTLS